MPANQTAQYRYILSITGVRIRAVASSGGQQKALRPSEPGLCGARQKTRGRRQKASSMNFEDNSDFNELVAGIVPYGRTY